FCVSSSGFSVKLPSEELSRGRVDATHRLCQSVQQPLCLRAKCSRAFLSFGARRAMAAPAEDGVKNKFARRDLLQQIEVDVQKKWDELKVFEVDAPDETSEKPG
ncbi:unnamed protein product, partial [Polarella glacialis]